MATMKNKSVGFNIESESERELLEYVDAVPNFSRYVKALIFDDLRKKKERKVQTTGNPITYRLD